MGESELKAKGFDPKHRANYAGNPLGYFRDILGIKNVTPDQRRVVELMETGSRVSVTSGMSLGKTFIATAYGLYFLDAIGSQIDPETGEPQGALWMLIAPTYQSLNNLMWGTALGHIRAAKRLGWEMGGFYSEALAKLRVREDWRVEGVSPPRNSSQQQAHGVSGRHHRNLLITIDEAAGVDASVHRAAEGVASGESNKILQLFNPTEAVSPARTVHESPGFRRWRIQAFTHPNVVRRKEIFYGALAYNRVEARILDECEDRGPYTPGEIEPDPAFQDFLWKMHPFTGTDRSDEIEEPNPYVGEETISGEVYQVLGHVEGEVRVYRPNDVFLSGVLGLFPSGEGSDLFPPALVTKGVEIWRHAAKPTRSPTQVGLDPAEGGGDEPIAMPSWKLGTGYGPDGITTERWYVGIPKPFKRGLPDSLASQVHSYWGDEPIYIIDSIGVGSGVEAYMRSVYGCTTVRFKASESGKVVVDDARTKFLNRRAAAYWRASELVKRGLVAIPDDPMLLEELEIMSYEYASGDKIKILDKDKIRKKLGRSPDRADAFVFSLWEDDVVSGASRIYLPLGGRALNGQAIREPDYAAFYAPRGVTYGDVY